MIYYTAKCISILLEDITIHHISRFVRVTVTERYTLWIDQS